MREEGVKTVRSRGVRGEGVRRRGVRGEGVRRRGVRESRRGC